MGVDRRGPGRGLPAAARVHLGRRQHGRAGLRRRRRGALDAGAGLPPGPEHQDRGAHRRRHGRRAVHQADRDRPGPRAVLAFAGHGAQAVAPPAGRAGRGRGRSVPPWSPTRPSPRSRLARVTLRRPNPALGAGWAAITDSGDRLRLAVSPAPSAVHERPVRRVPALGGVLQGLRRPLGVERVRLPVRLVLGGAGGLRRDPGAGRPGAVGAQGDGAERVDGSW